MIQILMLCTSHAAHQKMRASQRRGVAHGCEFANAKNQFLLIYLQKINKTLKALATFMCVTE